MVKPTYEEMLQKLNTFYDREEQIKAEIKILVTELEQVKEDKEMLQNLIMYNASKEQRKIEAQKWLGGVKH